MDLLQWNALSEVGVVAGYGARKYTDRNWELGLAWGRLFAAIIRHLVAFWTGRDRDPESGHLHLAHAAWNTLALLEYQLTETGNDDRTTLRPKDPEPGPESAPHHCTWENTTNCGVYPRLRRRT